MELLTLKVSAGTHRDEQERCREQDRTCDIAAQVFEIALVFKENIHDAEHSIEDIMVAGVLDVP